MGMLYARVIDSNTMEPLQLVVATNEEIASKPIQEHLTTICSTLKKLSDTKFNEFSVKNLQSVNLREMSPELDLGDENLQSLYNDLFLQLYKCSYDRLQTKHAKRWEVIEGFRSQYVGWQNTIALEQGTRFGQIESQETFLSLIERFWICSMGLRDCLDQFCRSGWKIDIDEMEVLKTNWQEIQTCAWNLLDSVVEGNSACAYWAKKVVPNGQQCNKRERPLRLRRAIEKLVVFHRQVDTILRFANSKRMRSPFFSSDITVIFAEKKRPTLLSWPTKTQEWEDLLGNIYSKHELKRVVGQKVRNKELKVAKRATRYEVAAKMHCECAIVAYLHHYSAFPAFSYIGVSRLSCKPCYYWIKAFNKTMNTRFRTKGCHDKWYGGWARLGLRERKNEAKVDAKFLSFVEGELCRYQIGAGMVRERSSSESSTSSEPTIPLYPPKKAVVEAKRAVIMATHGKFTRLLR